MAYSRAPQGVSDQSVPTTARAKSAIGSAQIGRLSDCRKALTSRNGTMLTSNAAAKIATSEVDQGSETAIRITNISAVVAQAAARAVDERGRTETGQDFDQQHFAAIGLDDLVADDLVAGIVAALHQHA